MDQDSFRALLASSRQSQPVSKQGTPTTNNNVPQKAKAQSISASESAFKPRKVKKSEGKYRDRASERREGIRNDYAEVEAVLEDFEKRATHENKDVIEEQRKYLGGDSQHTVLVKGLDMSLLEQNRARAAASTEDDDILEQAFVEATSATISNSTEPRKRTREEIIRDFKAKRQGNEDESAEKPAVDEKPAEEDRLALEAAKKAGKFKPIGFKPIGQPEEKGKKRKVKDGKEGGKKKKQKVEGTPMQLQVKDKAEPKPEAQNNLDVPASKSTRKPPEPKLQPESASLDEDFDIFAGAGDYEGFPDDDESDGEHPAAERQRPAQAIEEAVSTPRPRGWFDKPEPEVSQPAEIPASAPPIEPPPPVEAAEEDAGDVRLRPLESSALPSIRDFLAMDEAAEKAEKRKARKEKKKKKKKGGDDDDD